MPIHKRKKNHGKLVRQATVRGLTPEDYVCQLLDECDGNKSEAARRAGVTRAALHFWMRQQEQDAPTPAARGER